MPRKQSWRTLPGGRPGDRSHKTQSSLCLSKVRINGARRYRRKHLFPVFFYNKAVMGICCPRANSASASTSEALGLSMVGSAVTASQHLSVVKHSLSACPSSLGLQPLLLLQQACIKERGTALTLSLPPAEWAAPF